ncbi:5-formyltetrahydrofolate cyclo-ligase [Ammonifex degensii KC4]|uniref:5-formyltetrahydrofolate cyclo-ligase n=1 Tax=Ammonifex degensii (strain DSM 10501 / KC4) TaxID=429009 RepID=C9RAQ4_AMMDK|nr:5-formyltetrahydrofolate cyclo-ligase [Ammonifex degensii]ACX51331.1 5-formyltetrahydrofolate cyclo-ligase [Ammonifex degensii KC4]
MKKEHLRQEFLQKRLALSSKEVAQAGKRVAELFLSLSAYRQAKVLLLYYAFRQEVPTEKIILTSLAEGKLVALPVTLREKKEITARLIKAYPDDLVPGPGGIPEPRPTCPSVPPEKIDLVAVPGLVFDLKGYRLGYGWGCYDRFLSRSPALRVGLAYDFQIVEDVGAEPHDQRLHLLVTPSCIYHFDEVETWKKRSWKR